MMTRLGVTRIMMTHDVQVSASWQSRWARSRRMPPPRRRLQNQGRRGPAASRFKFKGPASRIGPGQGQGEEIMTRTHDVEERGPDSETLRNGGGMGGGPGGAREGDCHPSHHESSEVEGEGRRGKCAPLTPQPERRGRTGRRAERRRPALRPTRLGAATAPRIRSEAPA
jgi:hypothetical protein